MVEAKSALIILGIMFVLVGLAYFAESMTGKLGWFGKDDILKEIKECIQTCKEMSAELSMITPNSQEYNTQKNLIKEKSKECLNLNSENANSINPNSILESCGLITEIEEECTPSGETVYLETSESCSEGIQKCCSKKGLCLKGKKGVRDSVSCIPY